VTLGELSGEPPEVVVVGVADGSEAERAGFAAGDVVVAVDGALVQTIVDARARLSGPLGDDVVVTRRRGDVSESVRVPREAVRR
jgi:S1-C subfamily serine protease